MKQLHIPLKHQGGQEADPELEQVVHWLSAHKRLPLVGQAVREAIDSVLDGVHTGRYDIGELDNTEKTYIGTKVEHLFLHHMGLEKQPPLDTVIEGIPVDIKFSLTGRWMIPPEAFGKICILLAADDRTSRFDLGVIRAAPHWLTKPNRDKKCNISQEGRRHIRWLLQRAPLPQNLLLHLPPDVLQAILEKPRGQQQVTELFRQVHNHLINPTAVDTLGRQRDSSKRVRDARIPLRAEGIEILSVRQDRQRLEQLGFGPLIAGTVDGWVAVKTPAPDHQP